MMQPGPSNSTHQDQTVRFGGRGVEECRQGRLILFGSWDAGLVCHALALDRAEGASGALCGVTQLLPAVRVLAPDARPRHPLATAWLGTRVRDFYDEREAGRRAEAAFLALYEGIPFTLRRLVMPLAGFQWAALELAARIEGFAARLEDLVCRDLQGLSACLAIADHLNRPADERLALGRALLERSPRDIIAELTGLGSAAVAAAMPTGLMAAPPVVYRMRLGPAGQAQRLPLVTPPEPAAGADRPDRF